MSFTLHPQLAGDTAQVADLAVCRVLLMNHAAFPWLILVPMREGLRELHELEDADFTLAMDEVRRVSRALQQFTKADKMNIGALGNMVPQLHIHVIARLRTDAAWPNPVWNSGVAQVAIADGKMQSFINDLQRLIY